MVPGPCSRESIIMPKPLDMGIQLAIASLYFAGIYIVSDVFWPDSAFQYALIGLVLAMIVYLVLSWLGLHQSIWVGLHISIGVAILAFGLIWLVMREILRGLGRWPLD